MSAITNTTSATSSASSGALTGAAQQLGKNEFLKLLVAQLQNQDPLKPQDNSAFVAELAQFSNLEQTVGINDRLDALTIQTQGLQNSNIVDMVGAVATVRGATISSNGSGTPVSVAFDLAGDAAKVKVVIQDLDGNTIRTWDVGARPAGTTNLMWDGRNDQGIVQPKGPYTVQVVAKNASDATVAVDQQTKGTVEAVSFDKGYPVLELSNGVNVPVGDLLSLER